jgi:hypothetical protein
MGCFPLRTHFEQQKQKPDYLELLVQRYSKSVTIAALSAKPENNRTAEAGRRGEKIKITMQ